MWPVGQISAQARQPMQSGGGWSKGGAISRPAPRLTDEMAQLLGKMVSDPDESWWGAIDAMNAMRLAKPV